MLMPSHVWFLFPLMLATLCKPGVVKERVLVADDISTDAVTVDIRSDITGTIIWRYTNEETFLVKVKIEAENEHLINSTRIHFVTTNSTINLQIDEFHSMNAYEPVTGSGSLHRLPVCLVWLPALLLGFGRLPTVILTLLTGILITQSSSSAYNTNAKKIVHIEINAPVRLKYEAVNLYIPDGNIEYRKQPDITPSANITCHTDLSETGCPYCCHGNGVCSQGQCICNDNFTTDSNCEMEEVSRVFYTHPMDPRLETTRMYNGDTITLGYLFNFIQQQQDLKNTDKIALKFESGDGSAHSSDILVTIHSDGFIDEISSLNGDVRSNKVKFRRFKSKQCIVRVKMNNSKFDVNICEFGKRGSQKDSISDVLTYEHSDTDNKVNFFDLFGFTNFTDVQIKTERCGYQSIAKKFVFCELSPLVHLHNDKNHQKSRESKHETVTMVTHEKQNGVAVLRLPNSTNHVDSKTINKKCEFTSLKRQQICSHKHRQIYKTICDNISNRKDGGHSPEVTSFNISDVCRVFLNLFSNYCDIPKRFVETSCTLKYSKIVNLFESKHFQIRPSVLYSDDKVVTGSEHKIQIGSSHIDELTIIDTTPEFKIVKISVIPSDPVPHDIYQVRMDYECATKHTIVNMTVSGSDRYSNHMTCRGVTSCNCCIVHAAGAPNAVIDHVLIKVTDPSYGFVLEKETVIVF